MEFTFFIVDDDPACRKIPAQIIEDEHPGEVIGELPDGHGNVVGTVEQMRNSLAALDRIGSLKRSYRPVEAKPLGLEDYNNPMFERYGPKFFDFNELRLKVKELENKTGRSSKTRVNVRQFINALYGKTGKS